MAELTHFDADGQAHMVDVSQKDHTDRTAVAGAWIKMAHDTFSLIQFGQCEKGGCARRGAARWHYGSQEDLRAYPTVPPTCD